MVTRADKSDNSFKINFLAFKQSVQISKLFQISVTLFNNVKFMHLVTQEGGGYAWISSMMRFLGRQILIGTATHSWSLERFVSMSIQGKE